MFRSKFYRIVKTVILCTSVCFAFKVECFAAQPIKGTFTIPEMKIVYNNVEEILDSVIDFGKDKNVFAPDYNIFIKYYQYVKGDEYQNEYYLTIWFDRTEDKPWSYLGWYAFCKYRGFTIFVDELFAYTFTDHKHRNIRTFEYYYSDSRVTISPICEWEFKVTPVFTLEKMTEKKYSIGRFSLENRMSIFIDECDPWGK